MSQRIGLAISNTPEAPNDLIVSEAGLVLAYDALAVGQHVRQRLMTFIGEWFLDKNVGVPWLNRIMGRKFDPELAEAVVKAEILKTDGVAAITSFSIAFDKTNRGIYIREIEILTDYDEVVRV